MIDIHSHILPGIDDGSRNIEETAEMIMQAKEAGFDTIISTSHYMEDYYEADVEKREKLIKEVKDVLANKNIDMEILIGSEIYINGNINDYLKDKKASTLNNTNYVLFEFPLNAKPHNMYDLVFEIQKAKNIPILAHPERYRFIQNDPEILYELIDRGVLLQVNYGSFVGRYGSSAKDLALKMLKADMVHFLGSDCHRHHTVYTEVPEAISIVDKMVGKQKRVEITEINPMHIIKNEKFEIEEPLEMKTSIGDKIKSIFRK